LLQAISMAYRPVLTIALILSLAGPMGYLHVHIRRFFLEQEYCFLAGAVAW
jgi:hypothetical protein